MLLSLLLQAVVAESITMRALEHAPILDGRVSTAEYGAPARTFSGGQGEVRVWLVRAGPSVYIAAEIPDSTFYWGDDLVISLDPMGDRTPGPGHDDTQWYLRRQLDSSVVYRGRHGRWAFPNDDPDWRLGTERSGAGWEVRSVSTATGWSLELRLDGDWFAHSAPRHAAIAFRQYDDAPHGWYVWPVSSAAAAQPRQVERRPEWWADIRE